MKDLESEIKEWWDSAYRSSPYQKLPWETIEPEEELVRHVSKKNIERGKPWKCAAGLAHNRYTWQRKDSM